MYDWNDILIVGDSFCSGRYYAHEWPQLLTCALTGQQYNEKRTPRGHGFSGASWWSARRCIIDELNTCPPVKVLIVCHTDAHRIPSDDNHSLNSVSVEHRWLHQEHGRTGKAWPRDAFAASDLMPERMALAGKLYYEQLISRSFNEWAVKRWFLELEEIVDKSFTIEKSIHLFCFDGDFHVFKNGVTVEDTLSKHRSRIEVSNHFDHSDNFRLAKTLQKILDNYPGKGQCYTESILGE